MIKTLKDAVYYSTDRVSIDKINLNSYISTDNLIQNKLGKTDADKLPSHNGKVIGFIENDILVANIRPYLKKIWHANMRGGSSADVLTFRVKDTYIPKFVYYVIFRDEFFEHMMNGSKGTKMPRGDKTQILNFPIPFFEINEQKKIAKVLSLLDEKIALNNKIDSELEAMAKLIYDYWFVQFEFPDANGKPYKSSGGKMVYNESLKLEIPEGWVVRELNDCVDAILDHRGKTPKKLGGDWTENEDGIIALSAKLIKNGKLCNLEKANKVDQAMFDKWMPEKLRNGDILMTSEAPAGEFYFISGKTEYCMSQRLFAIRAKQRLLLSSYLYYELSRGHGYSQIMRSLSGSTVFGIRQDVLRKIKVVVPSLALQNTFDRIVLPQLKQIKCLDKENFMLVKLRDWLLPMLMNGQVTVKEAHNQCKQRKLKNGSAIL